ncbi:MAG TPA: aspartyl protease family protein [Croceibacterium sp.]|nr:aspartyl protease family protein [Croceibacterium sp.]
MSWYLLAAVAAAATQMVSAATPAQSGPTPEAVAAPAVEIIELEAERYRRMTVPVTIGGAGPFRFMLDTGAQATVVSRDLADRLALNNRKPAILIGMASRREIETTPIEDVALGSRTFYIRNAPVVETANIGGADGILGLDSLQDQRVLLDFVRQEIAIADADELGGNRGYEIVVKARRRLGQLIITEARLDGIKVAVVVDSGAQGSIGNPALLQRFRRNRHLGETEVTDINGQQLSGMVKLGTELQVGRARLENFPILFADSPTFHGLGLSDEPALILGMSELKLFRRVAIDFRTRRVLFDLPPQSRLAGRGGISVFDR